MGTRPSVSLCLAFVLLLAIGATLVTPPAADAKRLRVTITKKPRAISDSKSARVRWRANRQVRRALCRLDRRPVRRCGRRMVLRRLKPGRHRFRVVVRRGRRRAADTVVWRVRQPVAKQVRREPPPGSGPRLGHGAPTSEPISSDVVWRGDMEGGDLSEWYAPERSPSGNYGGGEYNSGGGDAMASTDVARSGAFSAKASLPFGSGGTRLFRWREPRANRELIYSAWFYIPSAFQLTGDSSNGKFWDIFQFKSRSTTGAIDPIWYVDLKNRPDGSLYPTLIWWHRTLPGPHDGESGFKRFQPQTAASIPTGRWFQVKARMRQSRDFDGLLQVWIDGQLAFDQQGVRTSYSNCTYNAWCTANEWSVNNYSDGLAAAPATLYIDDAQIGR